MPKKAFARAKIAYAAVLALAFLLAGPAAAQSVRIKDSADVEGVGDNRRVG